MEIYNSVKVSRLNATQRAINESIIFYKIDF